MISVAMKKGAGATGRGLKVEVEFHPSGRRRKVVLGTGATGQELLKKLDLRPDAHILVREDSPIPLDDRLRSGDRIRILSVTSGG